MNVEDLGNSFLKGHDRRRTISDSERFAFPNLCHGTLIARFNSREGGRTYYVGSGTLVGEQSVLTAAHLLYDLELSLAASTVSFFPGNGALPIDGSNARHVIIPETFVKREVVGGAGENNFALVTLDKPLGRHFGFMGLRAFSPEQDKEVAISGYGSYPSSTANMQGMSGKVTARSAQRFSYDIDTRAGLTGVGVCDCFPTSSYDRWNSGWRSSHHCIGVHTAGRDCFTHSNLGTIIDADKLASLMEWMKA
jgi:V8-like Glu-specific endopeptidase